MTPGKKRIPMDSISKEKKKDISFFTFCPNKMDNRMKCSQDHSGQTDTRGGLINFGQHSHEIQCFTYQTMIWGSP
jgi:hypothetical protein